jgi:hypothetical protein
MHADQHKTSLMLPQLRKTMRPLDMESSPWEVAVMLEEIGEEIGVRKLA